MGSPMKKIKEESQFPLPASTSAPQNQTEGGLPPGFTSQMTVVSPSEVNQMFQILMTSINAIATAQCQTQLQVDEFYPYLSTIPIILNQNLPDQAHSGQTQDHLNQTSLNPSLPDQVFINPNQPDQVFTNPNLPDQVSTNSSLPDQVSTNPSHPSQATMNPGHPTQTTMNPGHQNPQGHLVPSTSMRIPPLSDPYSQPPREPPLELSQMFQLVKMMNQTITSLVAAQQQTQTKVEELLANQALPRHNQEHRVNQDQAQVQNKEHLIVRTRQTAQAHPGQKNIPIFRQNSPREKPHHSTKRVPSSFVTMNQNASSSRPTENSNKRTHQNQSSRKFTLLPESLSRSFEKLKEAGLLHPKPILNPPPRTEIMNEVCLYHQTFGHTTDSCKALHHAIQDLIDAKIISHPEEINATDQ